MSQDHTIVAFQPLLHRIAYNLVRCKEDAEDIVQETFLKWLAVDHQKIENTKAYLIRAVKNNCLNHLDALKRKKEECLESWHASDLAQWLRDVNFGHLDLDINMKAAFKVMQSKLQPLERAVFLLKEVFDFDYEALQRTLDKNKDHCRQLFCRAKKKLTEESARINLQLDLPDKSVLLESFRKACDMNSASTLIGDLKKDIAEAIRKKF